MLGVPENGQNRKPSVSEKTSSRQLVNRGDRQAETSPQTPRPIGGICPAGNNACPPTLADSPRVFPTRSPGASTERMDRPASKWGFPRRRSPTTAVLPATWLLTVAGGQRRPPLPPGIGRWVETAAPLAAPPDGVRRSPRSSGSLDEVPRPRASCRAWPTRTADARRYGRPGSSPRWRWRATRPARAPGPGRSRGTAACPGRRPRGR
jgi:hypothetical protein